ncbi:peptidoglycan DD-metalloendopeptidase family protein [Photobacterium sp. SDRW27]|uniref:peptidoglycan DD-metalloendopeptidase family protein n=1 Tax=Photobacterium obscurum TaxID=2829490 RepID=UPI002244AF7B|nr:peptidoglycan DD-metalloendopeptidase family protein [Photobacterium obscurum]MCW8330608.1 peptidoglycan DD-metalloendopeptidase family protein [Photobacterium obscurum]
MNEVVKQANWRTTTVAVVCLLLSACSNHNPAPVASIGKDYGSLERGSFRGSYYEVNKGDTLYFISYITGREVKDIIASNKLSHPYTIYPGQKLQLWKPKYVAPEYGKAGTVAVVKPPVKTASKSPAPKPKPKPKPKPVVKSKPVEQKTTNKDVDPARTKEYSQNSKSNKVVTKRADKTNNKVASWTWPTKGRVIANFSSAENGNKGIDIAGKRGQAVQASAGGIVVYAGNALRGYGNLVIIKHSDDYLSAYAHNDNVLVKEKQTVKAGQKIASMGSSGTNSVRLHFEIRYKGKSVNPLRYLPK